MKSSQQLGGSAVQGRGRDTGHAPSSIGTRETHTRSLTNQIAVDWRRERPDLDLDEFLLSLYAMRLGNVIQRKFDVLCEERFGISGSDMRVLFALRRTGRPFVRRPTDLFRALAITSGAITKKVDRLVQLGFAARLPDPSHGGGFLVQLTRSGMRVADEAVELIAHPFSSGDEGFAREDIDAGMRFVIRALSAMETDMENGSSLDKSPGEGPPEAQKRPGRKRAA